MSEIADESANFRAEFPRDFADVDAGASWPTMFQAVAVGAMFGLVMAFGSMPAAASNEASGYREADQSIIAYNGASNVGAASKAQPDTEGLEKSSKLLGKLGGFTTQVAPQEQITLEELAKIDPSAKPKKK